MRRVNCSHCGEPNRFPAAAEAYLVCWHCDHRPHLPKDQCDCAACRLEPKAAASDTPELARVRRWIKARKAKVG